MDTYEILTKLREAAETVFEPINDYYDRRGYAMGQWQGEPPPHRGHFPDDATLRIMRRRWAADPEYAEEEQRLSQQAPQAVTCKLTDEKVLAMREEYRTATDTNSLVQRLATKYGVNHGTASLAIHGLTWRHVPGAVSEERSSNLRAHTMKVTAAQIQEMRQRWPDMPVGSRYRRYRTLAEEYGLSYQQVARILKGHSWAHVTDENGHRVALEDGSRLQAEGP